MSHPIEPATSAGQVVSLPGQAWGEIIRRPSLDAFAAAFSPTAMLEGSVFNDPVIGPMDIRKVFDATRTMYDAIEFQTEVSTTTRTYLEWKGTFRGRPVAGVTVLSRGSEGLIDHVRLYHQPKGQVESFSTELRRLFPGDSA